MVLAGGAGRRMGGAKATAELAGRPLIAWPLAALGAVLDEVVVVAKADTVLPGDLGVAVWIEPDEPRHPLAGLRHALAGAQGRAVLVCAADLPCVRPDTIDRIATAPGAGAVLGAGPDGRAQPLLGRYPAGAAAALAAAADDAPMTAVALALAPSFVAVPAEELRNVNTAEDLRAAAAALGPGRDGDVAGARLA